MKTTSKETAMTTESQFGIKIHAQLQTIGGKKFEFQPEHLLCDKCWDAVDTVYAHASYFGACTSLIREAFGVDHDHGITVTKIKAVAQ